MLSQQGHGATYCDHAAKIVCCVCRRSASAVNNSNVSMEDVLAFVKSVKLRKSMTSKSKDVFSFGEIS